MEPTSKSFKKSIHWLRQIHAFIIVLICLSCQNNQPPVITDTEGEPTQITAQNQGFIVTATVDKNNFGKLKSITENDLFPTLAQIKDLRTVKVFTVKSSGETIEIIALFELANASDKQIKISGKGSVVGIDFASFFQNSFKADVKFKNIVSLKEIIKTYDIKAYDLNEEFSFDRNIIGFAGKK